MHERLMEWNQMQDQIEEMEEDLIADFPDFQHAMCTAILEHVCEHDSEDEGICCLGKKDAASWRRQSLWLRRGRADTN